MHHLPRRDLPVHDRRLPGTAWYQPPSATSASSERPRHHPGRGGRRRATTPSAARGREFLEESEVAEDASRRVPGRSWGCCPGAESASAEPRPARGRGRGRLQQPALGDPQLRRRSSPKISPQPRPRPELGLAPRLEGLERRPRGRSASGEWAAGLTRQLLAFARGEVIRPQVLDLNRSSQRSRSCSVGPSARISSWSSPWPATVAHPGRPGPARAGAGESRGQGPRRHARWRGADLDTGNMTVDADTMAGLSRGAEPGRYVGCGPAPPARAVRRGRARRLRAVLTTKARGRRHRARPGHRLRDPDPGRRGTSPSTPSRRPAPTFTIMLPVTAEAAAPDRRARALPADAQGRDRPGRGGRGRPPIGDPADLHPERATRCSPPHRGGPPCCRPTT